MFSFAGLFVFEAKPGRLVILRWLCFADMEKLKSGKISRIKAKKSIHQLRSSNKPNSTVIGRT